LSHGTLLSKHKLHRTTTGSRLGSHATADETTASRLVCYWRQNGRRPCSDGTSAFGPKADYRVHCGMTITLAEPHARCSALPVNAI
jgi:hypothetical protein